MDSPGGALLPAVTLGSAPSGGAARIAPCIALSWTQRGPGGAVWGVMRGGPPRTFTREVTNMRGLTLARTRAGSGVESGSRVGRVT